MKRFLPSALVISLVFTISINAQNAYRIPNEVIKAYKNGTRNIDGRPGPNYWQNSSNYNISAELHAEASILKGEETVWYYNNSPDSLKIIVLRLYQNIFKLGNARGWSMGDVDLGDGMLIDTIIIDKGIKRTQITSTNQIVYLKNKIAPADSCRLFVKWQFHIPEKRQVRMGNYGNDIFYLAYWYPQIAVYDDIDGWDLNEYLGATEFYNDFNNYNVNITVPDGFAVWACGDLQNPEEHFQKGILKSIEKAWNTDEVVNIITPENRKSNKVFIENSSNQWSFKADYVPDFTFAATKNYNWDAKSVIVDTITLRRVFVDAVYPDEYKNFNVAAKWAAKGVEIMSFDLPGVPFPYEHITSFSNGRKGGGMEAPMMANDGDPTSLSQAVGLFFHENSHSYFPFYMGNNERKYAWMDEGWATYLTYQIMDVVEPDNNYMENLSMRFENINGSEKEVSLMTMSYNITDYSAYRVHAYNRSSLAYHFLRDALGDSVFKNALHEYMYRWQGRHPLPYDFFACFSDASGRDLNWFIKPWFFETAVADMGLKKITNDNKIIVENYGGLPLPIKLNIEYTDGSTEIINKNTSVWSSGDNAVIISANSKKTIRRVILGDNNIPDINRINNIFAVNTTDD